MRLIQLVLLSVSLATAPAAVLAEGEGFRKMRGSAEDGDVTAQYLLALGLGGLGRQTEAMSWLRRAADQGHSGAQYEIGFKYTNGLGVAQDHTEATVWYLEAGEQGHRVAQLTLGLAYARGQGVPKDQAEAARWYRRAADRGQAQAQYNLAVMYLIGEGVPEDPVRAYHWLNLARASGEEGADEVIEKLITVMTREQIAEGQRLASEWYEAHRAE